MVLHTTSISTKYKIYLMGIKNTYKTIIYLISTITKSSKYWNNKRL